MDAKLGILLVGSMALLVIVLIITQLFSIAILPIKTIFKASSGAITYRSDILSDIWGLGYCTVGDCTPESAGYVARYVTKK